MPSSGWGDSTPVCPRLQVTRLVLASASPRRQELLRRLLREYEFAGSDVEARGSDLIPAWPVVPLPLPPGFQIADEAHPTLWAWRKAVDVASQLGEGGDALILGADTVVIGEGTLLGKPRGADDAASMLRTLRGKKHYVATGFALVGADLETRGAGATLSGVHMRDYSEDELRGYVATGEPLDKAGAYAVQGLGGKLVSAVEGCYNNVVGLPLCAVRQLLESAAVQLLPYPDGGYCDYCPLKR